MSIKVVVFDFDGTVADTMDAVIHIINRLAGEFGYKQANQTDVERLKKLTSREIIIQADISIFKIPLLIQKLKLELNREIPNINFISGMKEALIELKDSGTKLGIITSNSQENVKLFLQKDNLVDLFDYIYSGSTLFGKSKVINKFLSQENLAPEEIIYVGDEVRDIQAAKKSQIKMMAVSWGFHSKQVLAAHHPDFLIDRPNELIEAIASLQK